MTATVRARATRADDRPMRFAIADPPYIGQARRHYGDHPDYAGEVDHAALVARLVAEYPDGWALCLSSPTLKTLLNLCPEDVRVGAWVKPWCSWKKGVTPVYAWEPVIWRGGRTWKQRVEFSGEPFVRDWVAANILTQQDTRGSKPEAFSFWVFQLLGARDGDVVDDLFPGSGAVGRAWTRYRRQLWSA